jgi:hypothetical protein
MKEKRQSARTAYASTLCKQLTDKGRINRKQKGSFHRAPPGRHLSAAVQRSIMDLSHAPPTVNALTPTKIANTNQEIAHA